MVKYEHDVITSGAENDVIAPDSHVTSTAPSPYADFAPQVFIFFLLSLITTFEFFSIGRLLVFCRCISFLGLLKTLGIIFFELVILRGRGSHMGSAMMPLYRASLRIII